MGCRARRRRGVPHLSGQNERSVVSRRRLWL